MRAYFWSMRLRFSPPSLFFFSSSSKSAIWYCLSSGFAYTKCSSLAIALFAVSVRAISDSRSSSSSSDNEGAYAMAFTSAGAMLLTISFSRSCVAKNMSRNKFCECIRAKSSSMLSWARAAASSDLETIEMYMVSSSRFSFTLESSYSTSLPTSSSSFKRIFIVLAKTNFAPSAPLGKQMDMS